MRLCERPLPPLEVVFVVLVDSWRSCRRKQRRGRARDALLAARKLSIMDECEESAGYLTSRSERKDDEDKETLVE